MKTWYEFKNIAAQKKSSIYIFEEIGAWGVSAKSFIDELRTIPTDHALDVYINSPGGSVFDGHAIFNALSARKANVTTYIEGYAASMASVIALAGSKVVAAQNSWVMIHEVAGGVFGGSEEMRREADLIDRLSLQIANIYVAKTGKDLETVQKAMADTSWFSADEAKAWGLVDEVSAPIEVAARFDTSRLKNFEGIKALANNQKPKMKNLMNALAAANLVASADLADEAAAEQARASLEKLNQRVTTAEGRVAELENEIATKQAEALKARADAAILAAVACGKIKDDSAVRSKWVNSYVANEAATIDLIASLAEVKAQRDRQPLNLPNGNEKKADGEKPELQGRARVAAAFSNVKL